MDRDIPNDITISSSANLSGAAASFSSTLDITGLSTRTGGFLSLASSTVTANLSVGGPLSASSTVSIANELFVSGTGTSTIAGNLALSRLSAFSFLETPILYATSTTASSSIAYGLTIATSGGLVGIGTSTPNRKLQVFNTI